MAEKMWTKPGCSPRSAMIALIRSSPQEGFVISDELNLQSGLGGKRLGRVAQLLAQRFAPAWVIEQAKPENLAFAFLVPATPG